MTHLHPKDTGGAILSLDYMHPAARWEWGGPDWQQHVDTSTSLIITAAELQADDPADMARRWARALGLVAEQHHQTYHIALQQSEIRFVSPADGRGDGLAAIDVVVRDPEAVRQVAAQRGLLNHGTPVLAGTRVRLIQWR